MSESQAALLAGLNALSSFFVGDASMKDTLLRVAELSMTVAPKTDFVGMTMMSNGALATSVFTDVESPQIDQAQYESGRGPCIESFRTGRTLTIDSTRRDHRWPEFAEACLDHGILSTLSLPLTQGETHLGAMNQYSRREAAFDPETIESTSVLAKQASIVLANAAAYWDAKDLSEQLSESVKSRAVIEQAKGIIMGSMRCNADEAFGHLVKQSQHMNIKLREVAQRIVDDISRASHG